MIAAPLFDFCIMNALRAIWPNRAQAPSERGTCFVCSRLRPGHMQSGCAKPAEAHYLPLAWWAWAMAPCDVHLQAAPHRCGLACYYHAGSSAIGLALLVGTCDKSSDSPFRGDFCREKLCASLGTSDHLQPGWHYSTKCMYR